MNVVAIRTNDVMLRINNVALHANVELHFCTTAIRALFCTRFFFFYLEPRGISVTLIVPLRETESEFAARG